MVSHHMDSLARWNFTQCTDLIRVLETVSFWKGDGRALHALEGDLTYLCPLSAGHAQLDYKVAPESNPSGDCRTHIGLVLSTKIKKLKEKDLRVVKAHEEWTVTRRGSMHPWNHSVPDLPGSASIPSPSQFHRQASIASRYSQALPSETMPDPRSMYRDHAAFTPTRPSHHASPIAVSEHKIPHARSTVSLQREFSSAMAYSSSIESQRAFRHYSSSTYTTDATSLPQSPDSLGNGTGKQLLVTTPLPKDGSLCPNEDFFDAVSSVKSYIAPSHHSSLRSTRLQNLPKNLQEARIKAEMNVDATSRSTTRSSRERSTSISSYVSSMYTASEESYPRYPSSQSRYRGGTLRTVGTLPPVPFGMNVPHSGISAPRDGRSSGASSYLLATSHRVNPIPSGLISGEGPVPRQGSVPPRMPSHPSRTPSLISFAQNSRRTHYNLSNAQNSRQTPTQHHYSPTVDAFAGPHRSANTASWDVASLESGDEFIMDEIKRQRHGVSSQSRRRPACVPPKAAENVLVVEPSTRIINPKTRQPFMTLYERIEDLERMGARR